MYGEFYMGFFEGADAPAIVLTTTEKLPVSYSVEAPGVGFYKSGFIEANIEAVVYLPYSVVVLSYDSKNKGIYVRTNNEKVTVMGQTSLLQSKSTERDLDTYVAIQCIDLCMYGQNGYYEYIVMSTHSSGGGQSIALVVGTEDNTTMTLSMTLSVTVIVDNITANYIDGGDYIMVINRLQTVLITSHSDFTGSMIFTNKLITLLSGHECGNIPWNGGSCSHLIEQIPPTVLWGKLHYVTNLGNFQSVYAVKILALERCSIHICCGGCLLSFSFKSRQFVLLSDQQFNLPCTISSSAKILVAQFSFSSRYVKNHNNGEPMMAIVPPTEQYYSSFVFSFNNSLHYNRHMLLHYVNIIVLVQYYQPKMIYLISGRVNKTLDTQEWRPIKRSIIEAYAMTVAVPEGMVEITHTNPNALLTISMYGFAKRIGYGSTFMLPHLRGTRVIFMCTGTSR